MNSILTWLQELLNNRRLTIESDYSHEEEVDRLKDEDELIYFIDSPEAIVNLMILLQNKLYQ